MALDGRFIELVGFALDDPDRVPGAFSQARSQAVAVHLRHQSCLAVNNLKCSLGASRHAQSAPVALLLVDLDDLPHHHDLLLPGSLGNWIAIRQRTTSRRPPPLSGEAIPVSLDVHQAATKKTRCSMVSDPAHGQRGCERADERRETHLFIDRRGKRFRYTPGGGHLNTGHCKLKGERGP
jgi:hypothetical protein